MRKLTTLLALFTVMVATSAFAQISGPASSIRSGTATPSLCTPSGSNIYLNRTTPAVLFCGATNTWTSLLTASGTIATANVANALKSATTTVNVSAATAPTSGQVLTATSGTAATWQTPAAASGANTALSNLAAVAINLALLPGTDNSLNLGSTGKRWAGLILNGDTGNAGIQFRSLSSGNTNRISYTDAVGPQFADENVGAAATFNVQSLSTNRTFTLPNAAGTFALTNNKLSVFAATTSAELAGVVSDETGSGALVFGTSPSITGLTLAAFNAAKGTCTLDGAVSATCTATVPSGCLPLCTYNSDSVANSVACSVLGTTLTAVSNATFDTGVVNFGCF